MSTNYFDKLQDQQISGTISTLGGTVVAPFAGYQSCAVVISGTWTGTFVIEQSCDEGVTWVGAWFSAINQAANAFGLPAKQNSCSINGTYKIFNTGGTTNYRVRTTALSVGTLNVLISCVAAVNTFTYASVDMQQAVASDTNNQSTTNLNAGQTFIGTSGNTLAVGLIQTSLFATQNCEVYVDQSNDGTNWDITTPYLYNYQLGGQAWNTTAVCSYYRVRVKNIGVIATTEFRLYNCLLPVGTAVPIGCSANGNFKISLEEMLPNSFGGVSASPTEELRVSKHVKLAGSSFIGTTFDTNFWTKTTTVGTGTATTANGELTLATGITGASSIVVNSVAIGRYIGGYTNYFRGNIVAPTVVTTGGTNIRQWGAFDAANNNGYFFEHNGTTLSIVSRKNGTDTKVSSGSFNGIQGTVYILDTTCHTFEIYWNNKNIYFEIDKTVIHTLAATTTPLSGTPELKVGMTCTNGASNVANNTLIVRAATINRIGELHVQPRGANISTNATTTLKYGAGALHKVTINRQGGNGALLTIYDNVTASGTIIAIIDVDTQYGTFDYDVQFSIGLTVVSASLGTGNATIIYE